MDSSRHEIPEDERGTLVATLPALQEHTEKEKTELLQWATTCEVETLGDYEIAISKMRAMKTLHQFIFDSFEPARKAADLTKKYILEHRDSYLDPLKKAREIVQVKVTAFEGTQEQARRQREEEIRRDQQKRLEDEQLARAQAAKDAGDEKAAEQILNQPLPPVAAVVVPSALPETKGVYTTVSWKFEVEDESLLPRNFLVPDRAKIGKHVRAHGNSDPIPGVRIWPEKGKAVRGFGS